MAVNLSELFDVLGKMFHAQETDNTARGTTVPQQVLDVITKFESLGDSLTTQEVIEGLATFAEAYGRDDGLQADLATRARNFLIDRVNNDTPLPQKTQQLAIAELITQMIGSGTLSNPDDDVDASTVSVAVTPGSGNSTDYKLRVSVTDERGRSCQHAYAETIVGTVLGEQIKLAGESRAASFLAHDWPQGSGSTATLLPNAAGGLLKNGGMDDEDDLANAPDDWILQTATVGTTLKMTDYEVQTLTIAGTPTSGAYILTIVSPDTETIRTRAIPYNATGPQLQSYLRELPGLENVTVSTTGTSPNYTHTVTFAKAGGNWGQFTETNTFDTGTLTPATSTAGSAHVYRGKALEMDANGSQQTAIYQVVSLKPRTVYAVNARMKIDVFPAAGAVAMRLRDVITPTVLTNDFGTSQSIAINPQSGGDLSTSAFTAVGGFFQSPEVLPDIVVFEIIQSTAISNGSSLYIDDVCLVEAVQLYPGGPYAAAFDGKTGLAADDTWDVVVSNDYAGEFQTFFLRDGLTVPGVLLPYDTGGGETIDDAVLIS